MEVEKRMVIKNFVKRFLGDEDVSRETIDLFGKLDMPMNEWIGAMRIKYRHMMTEVLTWDENEDEGVVLMKCKCGRIGDLSDHKIDDGGKVEPSVVCMNADCNFHEYVILDGWDDGSEKV